MTDTTNATNRTIKVTIDTTVLTINVVGCEPIVVDSTGLNLTIVEAAVMHGLKQKIVDAAAISRNPDNGRAATPQDKYIAMLEVANRLKDGQWNKAAGDGSTGAGGLLFRALCQKYDGKKTADEIKTFLDGKTKAEQAALRANPAIAAIIDTLRDKDQKDGTDSDALLAGLEG